MEVFISWSGSRSKEVALALRGWLKNVIQGLEPWMSDTDIEVGQRGVEEIFGQLKKSQTGIICVTPENMMAPWLHFEAGALSQAVGDKAKVCPALLDMTTSAVTGPLSEYQNVKLRTELQRWSYFDRLCWPIVCRSDFLEVSSGLWRCPVAGAALIRPRHETDEGRLINRADSVSAAMAPRC